VAEGPVHVIRIDVCEATEAHALATLLRRDNTLGAQVQVFGPEGTELTSGPLPSTPPEWVRLFDRGFQNNCFYVRSFPGQVLGHDVAFIEIANTTIQFFIDSPADPNGNGTKLAALSFFDNLIPSPSPGFQLFSSADFVSACGGQGK